MRILITGSHGLVGTGIIPALKAHFDLVALDIEEWDITDRDKGAVVLKDHKPDVVINLAAMTDVDGCESRPDEARRINSDGPATVADLCRVNGIRLIHFSTDYVFNGEKRSPYTERDRTDPISVYGKTKLSGETRILKILPSSIILRAQWIYGRGGVNFIEKVVRGARETGAARVVDDQRGAPTYAKDLGEPLRLLIERAGSGIYHVANSGSCTWCEYAGEIFSLLHMDVPLTPITSANLGRKAGRPAYSVFDCTKIQNYTGHVMRSWQEALKEYLQDQ
jgi:dTDP-4-dehydrorhamnose reductase